jgi:hypothetical protein
VRRLRVCQHRCSVLRGQFCSASMLSSYEKGIDSQPNIDPVPVKLRSKFFWGRPALPLNLDNRPPVGGRHFCNPARQQFNGHL